MRPGLLLLVIMLLWAVPGMAATYYVSQGASGGDCSQTDSSGTNRSTINAGIGCLNAGDTLIIHSGTYNEQMNINRSGSNWGSGLITIKAAPQETVIVPRLDWNCNPCYAELAGIIVDCTGAGPSGTCIQGSGSSFYRMRNVESRGAGQGYLMGGGAHDLEILGFHSHHHGINTSGSIICPSGQEGQCHGIYGGGNNILIEGADLHHNNGYGMQFRIGPDSNITIRSNKMHHNTSGGIIAFVGVYDVYNNVSYQNGSGFWVVGSGGTSNVYQNTAYGNSGSGIFVRSDEGNVRIINNISLNNSGGAITVEPGPVGNVTVNSNLTTGSIGFQDPNAGDFRLTAEDNGGQFISGSQYQVDFLGVARNNPPDRGAYEFGGAPPPPNPDPTGLQVELKADGNTFADSSGKNHPGTPHNGVLANVTPAIVGTSSFGLDGIDDYIEVAGVIALRPLNFGISTWRKGVAAPSDYCNAIRMGDAWSLGLNQDGRAFCWVNFGPTVTAPMGSNILGTSARLLSCAYDGNALSLWVDTALVAQSTPAVPLVYSGSENLLLGGASPVGGENCPGTFDNFRMTDIAYTQADINNLFAEQVAVDGTSLTHSQFERANMAIGSILATDADLPAHDRTQAVALAVAIQRVGTTINQYFALECSKNGGAFTTLTNLFGAFGARIAPDSVLNMGDSVPVSLPTGGFTGVAGRVVANTINTGFTTTLATGQQTQWRYTIDFGGPALSGDTFDCRPVGLDSYANVKRITLADPSTFLGIKGTTLKGETLR